MSEMVERVARALCRYTWERHIKAKALPEYIDTYWHHHAAAARIAIEAMREPTREMMDQARDDWRCEFPEESWKAMVAVVLSSGNRNTGEA